MSNDCEKSTGRRFSGSIAASFLSRQGHASISFKLSGRGIILLLAIVGALRLTALFWIVGQDPDRIVSPDSRSYEDPAISLVANGKFLSTPEPNASPEVLRTPGYPLFLAAFYRVFENGRTPAMAFQVILSVCTIALTFCVARRLLSPAAVSAAVLLYAIDSDSFFSSFALLSDTLFTFWLMLFGWAGVVLFADSKISPLKMACVGLLLAITTLVRPITYYAAFVIFIALGFDLARRRFGARAALIRLSALALPWCVLVGGWQWRNHRVADTWEVSEIKNINLLLYRGAGIVSLRDGIPLSEAQAKLRAEISGNLSVAERGRASGKIGMRLIRNHPGLFLRITLYGAMKMILVPGQPDLVCKALGIDLERGPAGDLFRLSAGEYVRTWIVHRPGLWFSFSVSLGYLALIYCGGLLFILAVARGRYRLRSADVFLLVLALYLICISAGPEAYARFRVPLMPIFSIYAAAGWYFYCPTLTSPFRKGKSRASDDGIRSVRSCDRRVPGVEDGSIKTTTQPEFRRTATSRWKQRSPKVSVWQTPAADRG